MKEFWMVLGLFCYFTTTQRSFAIRATHSLTEGSLKASSDIHDNLGALDIGSSPRLNFTQRASMLQTTKLSLSRTIIASNNKANEVSTGIKEPIVSSLSSTLLVAHTRINEIVNNALSTNVSQEKLASKYSSLNMQSGIFRATEHTSAISSKTSVRKPEIALTTSEFSGIILPSWSVDKKYLPTSQAGVNSNGYSSQGALAKSAFSNGLTSQSGQFSSSNSILGRISVDYDSSASTDDGSRLFTKGSMSLIKLPRTFPFSSQTIRKTTYLNPRTSQTTLLFSDKADTSRSDATPTFDTKTSTTITTRKSSNISGMSLTTLVAKMTQDKSDVASAIFPASRTTTQNVASSLVHSDIQKDNSLVPSVVLASPSLPSKAREVSSLSRGAALTSSITPVTLQGVPSRVNSKLSSRLENEIRTLTISDEKENSSLSFTTKHSSRISASDSPTIDSVWISQDESAHSVAQGMRSSSHVSSPIEKTTRLAVSSFQTQPLRSKTYEINLETSFAVLAKTLSSTLEAKNRTSSLKAEDMTEFLTQSMVQPTNWIPFSASDEFSAWNTDKNRKTWISGSSSLPQERSSPVTDFHDFSPSSSTPLDKSKLQTSVNVSAALPKSDITSGVVIALQEESATSHRAPSAQVGATIHPTQTISSLSTVSGNVSTGPPMSIASNPSHIKLPGLASSVIQSANQRKTSLVSSAVMASPSVSSKARKFSSQFSGAAVTSSTPTMIQPPVTSRTDSKSSSRTQSESRPSKTSSRNAKSSILLSLTIGHDSRNSVSISLNDSTVASLLQEMRSSAVVSALPERSSSLAVSSLLTESLKMTFADSRKTLVSRTSVQVRISIQATEDISSLSLSSTKAKTMTESPIKHATNWIPFSISDKFSSLNSDSYHRTWSSSSSRFSEHEIRSSSSSGSESLAMTRKLVSSSPSYFQTSSQIPHEEEVSAVTATGISYEPSTSHMSSRPMPPKRSSAVSEDRNSSSSVSFSASTLLDKSKLQTSSAVPATSPKIEITSVVIVPVPEDSVTSHKVSSTQLGVTVHPTQTSSTSDATVAGNISTGPPTTAATDTIHINLLIVVAIIPSIILCAFFAAVLLFRRSRKRRNKAVYSIKLEYADENNGFRKRCVNSRLDLSLKGIHIDLEFPNASSDRERRASYGRDSPRYSRGSTLSETQMRELQILSQECRENMEWISEVIAREMEASICSRIQPLNRESVYSVKEKENYEPSEKVIRRESSKRGRESVKWRVPVVQRRDSDDFDQRDSMCTDDTTLFPEEWKDGHENSERSTRRNGTETQRKSNQKPNPTAKENRDEAKLDKELTVQLLNKKLDALQSKDNEKNEKELQDNIPLTVNLNTKKEDSSAHVIQGKRSSPRPQRSEKL